MTPAPIEPLAWAAALTLLGAIIGSFVATLVIRWPAGRSVARGRSACDACGCEVRATDLIPVVSFLARRGRCRDCGASIDRRHLAIELLALLIGGSAGLIAPGVEGVAGAVFGWLLLALAALDLAAFWLPDRLTGLLALGGLASGAAAIEPPLRDRLIGGVGGFALLWLVGVLYFRLRGRRGLGGGDPKLLGAIGLWLGWRPVPAVLLIACLIGLGVAGWRLATGRRVSGGDVVPLGALLAIAAYPAWCVMVMWPS